MCGMVLGVGHQGHTQQCSGTRGGFAAGPTHVLCLPLSLIPGSGCLGLFVSAMQRILKTSPEARANFVSYFVHLVSAPLLKAIKGLSDSAFDLKGIPRLRLLA